MRRQRRPNAALKTVTGPTAVTAGTASTTRGRLLDDDAEALDAHVQRGHAPEGLRRLDEQRRRDLASASKTPKVVAIPFPPRNFVQIGKLCPITVANPMKMAKSTAFSLAGEK